MTTGHPWEGLFSLVQSPQQYAGGEWNADPGPPGKPGVTLIYPDVYEIGMSNFGLSIVGHLLRATGRFSVRRAFSPAPDMLACIRSRGLPWVTLGDGLPVSKSEVIGFGISCEILFPNVLMLLDLAGLPLRSASRDDSHPIVIAGGGGLSNPLPLSPFIDAFYLGEAEVGVIDLMDILCGGGTRESRLSRAAALPGVWIPSTGRHPVRWQRVSSLEAESAPVRQVVPLARITHDRAVVEIARGCTRGCRFCQATQLSRPVRERTVEDIELITRSTVSCTGWEDAGLLSLSFSDYSDLPELLKAVDRLESSLSVNISRPSLRPDTFVRLSAGSRISGRVTLAPEVGREAFRRRLNKDLSDEQILEAVKTAYAIGATGVKLYFMVGLPGEEEEDVHAIADLASAASRMASRSGRGCRGSVSISLSPFIPKPHTPLQWCPQMSVEEMRRRISVVRGMARHFTVGWNDPDAALLEGLFGLGNDRETSAMLEEAAVLGAGFEGWNEHFKKDLWSGLYEAHPDLLSGISSGLDPSLDPEWSFVDAGSSVSFLRGEYLAFIDGRATPDCREAGCQGCGACDQAAVSPSGIGVRRDPAPAPSIPGRPPLATMRVRFSRLGLARFSSQLDLVRLWMRVVRRACLPVSLTAGHVTRPRVRFGPALPLGFESSGEYIDILLSDTAFEGGQFDLPRYLPEGFGVTGARLIRGRIASPEGEASIAEYEVSCDCDSDRLAGLLGDAPGLIDLRIDEDKVIFRAMLGKPCSRPDRIVAEAFPDFPILVRRIEIYGSRDGASIPLLLMHEGDDLV